MTYRETLSYLFSQLPMYQRIGGAAYKDNLNNTIALCNLLGNPQDGFHSVHIAGTNGKGSVSHMLASILQEHGFKTGLYTSPHLKDFRERIRINGKMISKTKVINFVDRYMGAFDAIHPSFFEMTVGLAFHYFRDEHVDIAIIETGMGGRLDSTNIIIPLVSVITNISHDHSQFLGSSIGKIAMEKAGIIKQGVPVVIGETQSETELLFRQVCKEKNAPVSFADQIFAGTIPCPASLKGFYQEKNIRTVLQTVEILRGSGFTLTDSGIRKGLEQVTRKTGLKGRWQILQQTPLVICDVGHNEAGISEVFRQIEQTPHHLLHVVFGMVNDKATGQILGLLPNHAIYYFCKADIPRGLDAKSLYEQAGNIGLNGKYYTSVKEAFADAIRNAGPDDLVFVGGSFFVVAEVLP